MIIILIFIHTLKGANVFDSCISITHISLVNGLTILGYAMFASNQGLVSVTIPSTITIGGELLLLYLINK